MIRIPNASARIAVVLATSLMWAAGSARAQSEGAKPKFGAFGFDATGIDTATRPGDDFFRYANGAWVDRTEIPADKAGYSLRLQMSDLTEKRLHEMMEAAAAKAGDEPTTLEGKVGAFYRSFMDSARIEKLGASPLEPVLGRIREARTRDAIAALMGRNNSDFEGSVFSFYIDIDLKDPKRYAFSIDQAGQGLPDRDYYLEPSFATQKAKYGEYVTRMLTLLGWPEAGARGREILAFESSIAKASWTKTQQRDPIATYNPMSIAALETFAPGFPWRPFLTEAGAAKLDRVIVAEKTAFPEIATIFAKTPVKTLQAWLAFTVADDAGPYLPAVFAAAWFDLRQKTLSGQQQPAARWKRGVHAVSGGDFLAGDRFDRYGNLGWGVGQLYTARYFPPEAKAKIEALVQNLKAAYRKRLEALDWMGPETRAKAPEQPDTYGVQAD